MPLPPITRFSALATNPSPTNNNNGLYVPRLNTAKIAAIPTVTKVNGGMWYNDDVNRLEARVNNTTIILAAGNGNVSGPNISVANNIAVFADNTGHVIADSGVDIVQVPTPAPLLRFSNSAEASSATVNEIGNLGHLKFTNGLGLIFVDGLMPVEFITNTYKTVTQVCSLFTDGLPSSSTSPSALVEIQSDTGALLLSRMTTTERDALSAPSGANGMLLFNTTTTTFNGFDGTNWRVMPLLNTNGTLTAADPISSANLTTKNYVDTAIAVPAAAKFIIQTANASVPNAQVLGALSTGLLKNTTTTGVLTIGVPGTDYYSLGNPTRIIDDTSNFFIGTLAGNLTTTGIANTGTGANSLGALTNGIDNTGTGNAALKQNTTGSSNSSFGARALSLNISGSANSAFGTVALLSSIGSNNSAFGANALPLGTGDSNSSFGSSSLFNIVNGSNNVALGNKAAFNFATYNKCILIGDNSDTSVTNLTNAIAIGYLASVGASNSMVLGGTGANQLSVGIGITPNAQFQLPTIHANRKIVLYETANNDHQVYGFGTSAGLFNSQIDNTTSAFTWKAAASSSASNELMRLTGTGFLGIGTTTPHALLQFPNASQNRTIVLFETANNDHQVLGLGVNSGVFRFQIDASATNYVFYVGTSSTTSSELMRLTGTGNLAIGNSSAPARIAVRGGVQNVATEDSCIRATAGTGTVAKIEIECGELWELRSEANSVFSIYTRTGTVYGLSIYHPSPNSTIFAVQKQASATYYGNAFTNTTVSVGGTFTQLFFPPAISSTLNNYTYSASRLTYSNTASGTIPTINQLLNVTITAGHNGSTVGEVATFAIRKNGVTITTIRDTITAVSSTPQTIFPIKTVYLTVETTVTNTDYFEIWVTNSIARTITVTDFSFSISST